MNCLSAFDHFVGLALKELNAIFKEQKPYLYNNFVSVQVLEKQFLSLN